MTTKQQLVTLVTHMNNRELARLWKYLNGKEVKKILSERNATK